MHIVYYFVSSNHTYETCITSQIFSNCLLPGLEDHTSPVFRFPCIHQPMLCISTQNQWKTMQNVDISLKYNEFYWNFKENGIITFKCHQPVLGNWLLNAKCKFCSCFLWYFNKIHWITKKFWCFAFFSLILTTSVQRRSTWVLVEIHNRPLLKDQKTWHHLFSFSALRS